MDTFFTIYFIVVGGLLILNVIYKLIIFLKGDVKDWQYELAHDVLNWCLHLYPIKKQKPLLLTLVEGHSNLAGEYCFYSNTITIYADNNVLPSQLIKNTIHEFFHYYLITSHTKNNLYQKQLEHYGYENHPQEILCNTMADKLTKLYLNNK